ncbi:peptidoglycan-binding domain-containing protein [Thermomonospora umbrina]|uniref:Putative peptidoglycan binding protein n=1 Tax=Thermomonospora umbrina TaxID=111806 RepID=A0A3D9SH54_9ACTN|nr:peptidoglycan-binding protein [Thermomonospora umbrina]REE95248.1 putative peptidoglycan binding protein [Thermomonospora umbrina]
MTLRRTAVLSSAIATAVAALSATAQPAQARAADFASTARTAVAEALPGHTPRENLKTMRPSPLKKSLEFRWETATFTGRGRVIVLARGVGAVREATRAQLTPGARVIATTGLRRPGAGTRRALVTSTADVWGPGLTELSWSERRGVTYRISVRGPVTQPELVRLAQALPRDRNTVSKAVRALVAKAAPPVRPADLDRPGPGGASAQGTGNKIVDGSGGQNDDLTDEATLCNGCSYWNGNWAGMWQHLMYAEGKLYYSEIDCQFGSRTASATVSWQRAEGLAADGIVGPDSRGRADNYLTMSLDGYTVTYVGAARHAEFARIAGHYYKQGAKITYGYGGGIVPGC